MGEKIRFSKMEIQSAVHKLKAASAGGKPVGEVLKATRTRYEDNSFRMAYTLTVELGRAGLPLSVVESVDYERVDEHNHAIEINWSQRQRRRELKFPGRRP